jgi:hypothetical protein
LDSTGAPVREFSSDRNAPPPDLAKIKSTPDWLEKPLPLHTSPGQHRFVWDFRYEATPGLDVGAHESDSKEKGVWAPPGRYAVVLSANGKSERQWLTLKPDPRVKATANDYAREFQLAREIEAARVQVRAALHDAKTRHETLLKRPGGAALDAQLMAVADLPSDDPRNSVPVSAHSPETLQGLSEDFDNLAHAADGVDGAPTPDAESGLQKRMKILDAALRRWRALKAQIDSALRR